VGVGAHDDTTHAHASTTQILPDTAGGKRGDDIWVATPGAGNASAAATVARFATLTDCEAEPTGIYFDLKGQRLFVNVQHRGGDGADKAVAITPARGN
jgi:secreted PhoX family phosphatase